MSEALKAAALRLDKVARIYAEGTGTLEVFSDVSLAITAVGEAYMSFGWTGIVVGGLLFGWLAKFWSQLAAHDYGLAGSVLYSIGAMTLMIGTRSFIELVLLAYPIGCWYVLDRLLLRQEPGQ